MLGRVKIFAPLLGELVEDLEGELAGVFESAGGDLVQGVSFFVPIGRSVEVADEVEDGKVGPVHERDVVVEDDPWVGGDPILKAEFRSR